MALIEYLEGDDWQETLCRSLKAAIELLENDRFRPTSSSIDDVRTWLALGGIRRLHLQLERQMADRRLSAQRQYEIRKFLLQLLEEQQPKLLRLIAKGVIPYDLS